MNKSHVLDLLRITEALSCVSDITCMAGLGEKIHLGELSSLMWLCSDKLDQIMTEITEQIERDEKKAASLL